MKNWIFVLLILVTVHFRNGEIRRFENAFGYERQEDWGKITYRLYGVSYEKTVASIPADAVLYIELE